MELARLIPRFQALPELLVFRCPHCEHVETIEQPSGAAERKIQSEMKVTTSPT
jgi:hypothetical protein